MRVLTISLVLVPFALLAIGCQRNAPVPKAETGTVSGWYTVRFGDDLSHISVLFYGDAQYWYHLRELNVEMGNLEDSGLRSSDRIFIPNVQRNTDLLTDTEAGTTPKATRLNSFLMVENLSVSVPIAYFRSKYLLLDYKPHPIYHPLLHLPLQNQIQ